MDMDIELANRSLYAAGLLNETQGGGAALLAREDRESGSPDRKALYATCRSFYLATYLEALSEAPWASGRRRKRLLKTVLPHGSSGYRFAYGLPWDCARPLELSGKGDYVIEGNFLCTDVDRAELLYVSNGKVINDSTRIEPAEIGDLAHNATVLSPGGLDEMDVPADVVFNAFAPRDIPWHGKRDYIGDGGVHISEPARMPEGWDGKTPVPFPAAAPSGEDYPEYAPLQMEPKFYEYLEKALAARLAVKNTREPRLHEKLLQEALMVKQDAIASTKGVAAAKRQGSEWWADRLGLSGCVAPEQHPGQWWADRLGLSGCV